MLAGAGDARVDGALHFLNGFVEISRVVHKGIVNGDAADCGKLALERVARDEPIAKVLVEPALRAVVPRGLRARATHISAQ